MFMIRKKELTSEIKNMPVSVLLEYGISMQTINQLTAYLNIKTIGDLLDCTLNKLKYAKLYGKIPNFWSIRKPIMDMGLIFEMDKQELTSINAPEEYALIPVKNLNLPNRVKNALERGNIFSLGNILTTDYKELKKLRALGEDGLYTLKEYVHKLGFNLYNEEKTIKEIKEEYHSKNIKMIEDELDLDIDICHLLYKNGICTLNDLVNFGPKVFEIVGMGDFKSKKLKEAMKKKNITFSNNPTIIENKAAFMPNLDDVEEVSIEISLIKERVRKKEELLKEYKNLLEERKKLINHETSLDEEIERIKANLLEIKGDINHDRK